MWPQFQEFFVNNYDALKDKFLKSKSPSDLVDPNNKEEIIRMHEAFTNEMSAGLGQALQKDRLYNRPAGFIQDTGIWQMSVLCKYFI